MTITSRGINGITSSPKDTGFEFQPDYGICIGVAGAQAASPDGVGRGFRADSPISANQ